MSGPRAAAIAAGVAASDRLARLAERVLRLAGEPRVGLLLLLIAGAVNAAAAALPGGPRLLDAPAYALLLGAIVLSGMAAVAVRAPAAWREWRRPGPLPPGTETLAAILPVASPPGDAMCARLEAILRDAGYRTRALGSGPRWVLHGTRRGWSRFAALGSHLALVLIVIGAAVGAAFGSETTFSLLPGDQALLDAPRQGFTDAVRLEDFEAEFGPDGMPRRLDTEVTFLREGRAVRREVLQVNRPGAFGPYIVHAWTYGPAVQLRIISLGGQTLLDAPVPLTGQRGGRPFTFVELPSVRLTLGVELADASANELAVTAASSGGVVDAALLRPGEEARVADVVIGLDGFSVYVTFLSRSDPGTAVLFAGGGLLSLSLAIAFWLPRRRVSLRWTDGALRLALRGERFDRPQNELARLRGLVAEAL